MIKKLLKNIRGRFAGYLAKKPVNRWPIVLRARWAMKQYKKLEGHTFDLAHPELFTEKIVWYRLFYRHPDMTRIYDKYLFKDYIAEKLGPGWTAPLYGMWTDVQALALDWDDLPDRFCLKSNCSSLGQNIIFVRDKKAVDQAALFREVSRWLVPLNTAMKNSSGAYRKVTPRIIAEELLEGKSGPPDDYKVHCFDGTPTYIVCVSDRFSKGKDLSESIYDTAWNKLPVIRRGRKNENYERPQYLQQMLEISAKLSKDFPQVRVDFYEVGDRLYLGELTFYSGIRFEDRQWDKTFGEKFILPRSATAKIVGSLLKIEQWMRHRF